MFVVVIFIGNSKSSLHKNHNSTCLSFTRGHITSREAQPHRPKKKPLNKTNKQTPASVASSHFIRSAKCSRRVRQRYGDKEKLAYTCLRLQTGIVRHNFFFFSFKTDIRQTRNSRTHEDCIYLHQHSLSLADQFYEQLIYSNIFKHVHALVSE